MASSGANFTAAINALVAERDRVFLMRVATDYNLKYDELHEKYLETAEQAIKVPRKYTKKPKAVTVVEAPVEKPAKPAKGEKQCCTAQTSKKEPCKFSALKGEVFCKRHLRQSLGEEPKVPKEKKAAAKPNEVVHSHALDAEIHDDCDLCQTHGNPLADTVQEFEVVTAPHTGPVKPVPASVQDRLAAMLAEADESDAGSSDDDDHADLEEFEEED